MGEQTRLTRRTTLQTISGLTLAGLAGCQWLGSADPAPAATDAAPPPATGTPTPSRDTSGSTTATNGDGHEHAHTPPAETGGTFAENPRSVHQRLTTRTSVGPEEVMIGFRLEDSSLPFTTEVYHAPADATANTTGTYDTRDLSAVPLVPDPPEALATAPTEREDVHYATTGVGEPLTVTFLARQDGETLEWGAWRRTGYPVDGHAADAAVAVDCYCDGGTYSAPGEGTWARVIEVTPTERVDPGTTVVLNWTAGRA